MTPPRSRQLLFAAQFLAMFINGKPIWMRFAEFYEQCPGTQPFRFGNTLAVRNYGGIRQAASIKAPNRRRIAAGKRAMGENFRSLNQTSDLLRKAVLSGNQVSLK